MMKLFQRFALLAVSVACASCAQPRNDRAWYPYLSQTTHVDLTDTSFRVTPVNDWSYEPAGPTAETRRDASFNYTELRNVWFVLEPQPGSNLAAHTFLLFEFTGDRLLGVTIEARRETDEDYSALRGAFNAYELAYVWGSARDLLARRAVMLQHDVYMYPTAVTEEQKRDLLMHLLQRTQALETEPRFYNTLTSNCTNELAKATKLRWHYAFVLTGTSDDFLFSRGIIPGTSFAEAHARSDVTGLVRDLNASPETFDAALLAELRRRQPPRLAAQ